MAISESQLYASGCVGSGSTTTASSSISPAADSMLVVRAAHMSTGGYTIDSISDTFTGSGTWTLRVEPAVQGSRLTCKVWECQMGSSPGSGTVTVTWSNSSADHRILEVVELTGDSGTVTYVNSNHDGGSTASSTETITVSGYTSGNYNLGFFHGRDQLGTTNAGSETQFGTDPGQAGTHAGGCTQYITTSGSNTFTPNSTAGNRWFHKIALEYEEVSSGDDKTAAKGSVTAAAQDATTSAEIDKTAVKASATATAQDATFSATASMAAAKASVSAASKDAGVTIGAVAKTADKASVSATAKDSTVTIGAMSRTADKGTVSTSSKDAVATSGITVSAAKATVSSAAQDATHAATIDKTAAKGSVTSAAKDSSVTIGAMSRTADKATATATAKDASRASTASKTAAKATVAATSKDASTSAAISKTATKGTVSTTAKDASASATIDKTAVKGTVTAASKDAVTSESGGADNKTAAKGSVSATAQDASFAISAMSRSAALASVTAAAQDATFAAVMNVTAVKATVSTTSKDAATSAAENLEAVKASVTALAKVASVGIGAMTRTAAKATVTATAKNATGNNALTPINNFNIDSFTGAAVIDNTLSMSADSSSTALQMNIDTTEPVNKNNVTLVVDK